MVTDEEIANGVAWVLRQSDPNSVTTVNGVVQQLEAKLGQDLSHRASFIRHQIDQHLIFLRHHLPNDHFAIHPLPNYPTAPSIRPQTPPPTTQPHIQNIDFRFPAPPPPNAVAPPAPPPEAPPPKESAPTSGKRRGGPGGLNKLCGVSPALQAIVGEPAMPRTQIVKQLWAYIRKNNLQDPSNKRKIICNDELRLVFETDCTDMFKMNKLLAKHIITLEPTKDAGPVAKRLKVENVESATECTEPGAPLVIISTALARFFGTGEREMLQSEVMRRVREYIRINQLGDPLNSVMILCDSRLQELFGCENFSALSLSEMLMHHFFTRS